MNVNKIKKFIFKNRFPLLLVLITLLICSANYEPGTILSGWDTLHPEFNFPQYFRRIFFGVWQEHQGLGALATQAHASEIARMFIYYPMSIIIPDSLLRYSYFFLTIVLGPLGTYFFIREKILKERTSIAEVSSFLGGLFYLLNLGTLQHFYVPFEMFATHFASLPWILYFALEYIEKKNIKILLIFTIISFLSASIAHTSTLWFAFLGCMIVFLLSYSIFNKNIKSDLKSIFIIISTFLLINSFWLLPNLYFLITQGDSVSNSKIHTLFSEEAFAQNQAFGNIKDLLIFKNFLFNWGEFVGRNRFDLLLNEWSDHLKNPVVLFIGYLFSVISISGIILSILRKNRTAISLLSILVISIFFWFNSNPPFGFIYNFLRDTFPLFKEGFRFPFTKFSIILVFSVSVYFGLGINYLVRFIPKYKEYKNLSYYLFFIVLAAIIYYALPAFKGNFISPSMKVQIPNRYYQMFDMFREEPLGRVANLPIHSFWGWTYYDWYYQGAGFLWFGVNQPLLDREFDRWEPANEQYYREMSQAIYTENQSLFNNVIKKYDISHVFIDRSVSAPGPGNNPKILYTDEISKMLNQSPLLKDDADFESISIFKTKEEKSQIYLLSNPVKISPDYEASYEDFAFEKYGDYISSDKPNINYPFRQIINNQNRLTINPQFNQQGLLFKVDKNKLNAPLYQDVENYQPANVYVVKNQNKLKILVYLIYPNKIAETPLEVSLPLNRDQFVLSMNHKYNFRVGGLEENIPFLLGKVILDLNNDNPLAIYPSLPEKTFIPNIIDEDYSFFPCGKYDKKPVFGLDPIGENGISLSAQHAQVCLRLSIQNIFGLSDSDENSQTLLSIQYDFDGDNHPNLCVAKKDDSNCIYYFSKNLESNSTSQIIPSQYFSVKSQNIKNLEIKIFLDSTDLKVSKKVKYENISLGYSTPLSQIQITKSDLQRISIATYPGSDFSEILIPYSGNSILSQDITKLPKTGGDCPALNPRGPATISKEVVKNENSDFIRYDSEDGSYCDHFSYQGLDPSQGYLITIKSRNVKGLPIRLCVANLTSKRCDIYTHLPKNKDFQTDTYLLPPMNNENGFDININNFAIKGIPSINDVASIDVIPIPYNWLSKIEEGISIGKSERKTVENVSHPNPSLYTVSGLSNDENQTLVLSQSFDKGWRAYEMANSQWSMVNKLSKVFPFVFGKPAGEHVLVNNWANGWNLQQSTINNQPSTIIIVYLPQYLEYMGIILSLSTVFVLIIIYRGKNRKSS